ncbi:MAG: penicillin acylase family protein [Alphaproteobacteria bacterium]|nr:penicillin acylase family protein [Alphaproteobacteria bacterium]
MRSTLPLLALLAQLACNGGEPAPDPFAGVEATETRAMPGLRCDAQVVRAESNVPYVYAYDREDMGRVLGFVMARDRYFEMDLARRLGLGTVSELLGQDALETDMESRSNAMTFVADQLLASLTPDQAALYDAFAEGVNHYILEVHEGRLPPPSELELAAGLLGADSPEALMQPFDRRSVAGIGATLIYELGFETGDVGRAATAEQLPTLFEGAALGELRRAGAIEDIWQRVAPVYPVVSAPDWTDGGAAGPPMGRPAQTRRVGPSGVERGTLDRLDSRLARLQRRLGHDWEQGFGSNAWAVSGTHTTDGRALLAGDGHLPLSIPSLFWQIGLDTVVLGGGDTHQVGVSIPGLPYMAVGTNGRVAWSQTQLLGDITDWYREELQLDADGYPAATRFQDAWVPLSAAEEAFVIADVPLLGSVGRTETWARWTTADGRWIADVEGTPLGDPEDAEPGQAVVMLGGDWVVPGDVDGDGVITAISFDYTGLDQGNIMAALDAFGHSDSVEEFHEATKGLVAYSQNMVVADVHGSVLYTGFQAVPCRSYLDRGSDGAWADGADPTQLIDGTRYGSFTVPMDGWKADFTQSSDPERCLVPHEAYPYSIDPAQGYVLSANNDPSGLSLDESLVNDAWYIGGPWSSGYRADTIDQRLAEVVADGTADQAAMVEIQGDTRSRLGEQFTPVLIDAVAHAVALSQDDFVEPGSADERLLDLYLQDPEAVDEAAARLAAWLDADTPTPSGVETFYHQPAPGDDAHAVATTLFNAWFPRFLSGVIDDEGLPNVWSPWGSSARTRALSLMVDGRGPDNPLGLASWNPDTEETAFFDVLGTEPVETSEEVALSALVDALGWLTSEDAYGSVNMDTWIWGLKHTVHFDSILGDFLGNDGPYAAITEQFSITTDTLPLAADIPRGDPRADLEEFPRPGDQFSVDAANPGFSGTRFTYGSGPVFRMVVALGPDGVTGENIIPGGQSALTDSPYFADQTALWLANETVPMHLTLDEVLGAAVGREWYRAETPGPCP